MWAVNCDYNFSYALSIPFPAGIGIGYTRTGLGNGVFIQSNGSGTDLDTFFAEENSQTFSIGIGMDYSLKLGLGFNLKVIQSNLTPVSSGKGSAEGKATTADWGILAEAPLFGILKKAGVGSINILSDVEPLLNVTFGYARRNTTDDAMTYSIGSQPDPLPRDVTIGLSVELGLVMRTATREWRIVSFALSREAEDLLVARRSDGTFNYQAGLGDISFFRQVIRGDLLRSDKGSLHEGWELGLAEFIYLRGGSYSESPDFGNRNYATQGLGLRLGGLFKAIGVAAPESTEPTFVSFVTEHLDLTFDFAEYKSSEGHPLNGTRFSSFSLLIH